MWIRKWVLSAAVIAAASIAAPRTASADWFVTPFVGWNAGGSADVSGTNGTTTASNFEHKANFGVSVAGMGKGIIGGEVDFGYSPNFYSTTTDANGFTFSSGNNVSTLTGNVIVGVPVGGHGAQVRPYGVIGLGLIRSNVGATNFFNVTTKNDFGMDVGGGIAGFFTQNVGIRGDVRYFRGFRGTSNGVGLSNFNFWRTSIGLALKF